MEGQEKKLIQDIKKSAKDGQMVRAFLPFPFEDDVIAMTLRAVQLITLHLHLLLLLLLLITVSLQDTSKRSGQDKKTYTEVLSNEDTASSSVIAYTDLKKQPTDGRGNERCN